MGRTLNIAPLSSPTASSPRPHEPAENEAALAGVVVDLDDNLLVLAFLIMVEVEAVRPQHITFAPALPLELRPALTVRCIGSVSTDSKLGRNVIFVCTVICTIGSERCVCFHCIVLLCHS